MSHRLRALAAAPLIALTVAACGGSSDDDAAGTEPTEAASPTVDCVAADDLGEAIAKGANGPKITPTQTMAVKAPDLEKAYYVAMSFTVEGSSETDTGVWATNDLKPAGGMILAVDGFAKEFTDWPDAAEAFDITYPNDGTDAAESCLS